MAAPQSGAGQAGKVDSTLQWSCRMDLGGQNAISQIIIYSRHKSFETVTASSTYEALYMFKAQMVMFMPKIFELELN